MIDHLCLIGTGLIGGSFALSLKAQGLVNKVSGYSRNEANLIVARERGIIDEYACDPAPLIKQADLIFIAVPVSQYQQVFELIKPHIKSGTVITDGGSTKQNVIAISAEVFGHVPECYVPGHPIAGTEKSGPQAAFAGLYKNHKVILTPLANTLDTATRLVQSLWESIGAEVVIMTPQHHDLVLGATSHLPHAIAYTLVNMLANLNEHKEVFEYAAGGFKDFTRIASSDPVMWQSICMANKDTLLEHIAHFQQELESLKTALENDDAQSIQSLFSRAKSERDKLITR